MKTIKLVIPVLGLLLGILLSEAITRFYYFSKFSTNDIALSDNKVLIYEHKRSISFINKYGVEVKYNSLGFIGEEIAPKSKETVRILGVGDSITEAIYLPEEKNFLNQLKKPLNVQIGVPIEIINAAVGGYNTWQELELLRRKALSVHPDIIIVGICMNDFVYSPPRLKKTWFNGVVESFRDGSKARYFNYIYQRSDLYKLIYDLLSRKSRIGLGEERFRDYLMDYEFRISQTDIEKWKVPFLEMMRLAESENIKIIFVLFPLQNQVIKKESATCKPLTDFFRDKNAHYIDLIDTFIRKADSGGELFERRDLIHPTSLGHNIAAETIFAYIVDNKIL